MTILLAIPQVIAFVGEAFQFMMQTPKSDIFLHFPSLQESMTQIYHKHCGKEDSPNLTQRQRDQIEKRLIHDILLMFKYSCASFIGDEEIFLSDDSFGRLDEILQKTIDGSTVKRVRKFYNKSLLLGDVISDIKRRVISWHNVMQFALNCQFQFEFKGQQCETPSNAIDDVDLCALVGILEQRGEFFARGEGPLIPALYHYLSVVTRFPFKPVVPYILKNLGLPSGEVFMHHGTSTTIDDLIAKSEAANPRRTAVVVPSVNPTATSKQPLGIKKASWPSSSSGGLQIAQSGMSFPSLIPGFVVPPVPVRFREDSDLSPPTVDVDHFLSSDSDERASFDISGPFSVDEVDYAHLFDYERLPAVERHGDYPEWMDLRVANCVQNQLVLNAPTAFGSPSKRKVKSSVKRDSTQKRPSPRALRVGCRELGFQQQGAVPVAYNGRGDLPTEQDLSLLDDADDIPLDMSVFD